MSSPNLVVKKDLLSKGTKKLLIIMNDRMLLKTLQVGAMRRR